MIKFALVVAAVAGFASVSFADQVTPSAEPAAPVAAPAPAAAATTAAVTDTANDPRMIAAIRHANARADQKCGAGAGLGITDLATKAAARTCRRHMVNAAMTDAAFEIEGH